ncbi:MAG: fumarate reductase/succinate dehydrogenase flavoprotein subunit [Deltaproteobacteria bacterium]|nr:MAG: fumarate reductase/succinate dehydrogenase flavoprotein subunit [Deltaproteobacteria bacterium]
MERYESHSYDVVVVGAGGAGLRAAIEAAAAGCSVGLVCKSLLGKAHTVMAEGGVAAALATTDPRDSWKVHFRDTMRGGKLLNDWRMAKLHAQEAPARVNELEAWGALFDRTPDGRILQRNFGGHQYPRLAHVGDRTGLEMIRTLQDKTVRSPGVDVYMETTVAKLLKDGDHIAGALAYRRDTGRFIVFRSKAVVLATGGIGRAYRVNSNSWEYTGDGHALAYAAGADLVGMEFVQFHPTGMVWPLSVRGILITEGVRGEGGVLKNARGERFMFRYIPEMFRKDFADSEEEADRWVAEVIAGRKAEARRPPELLTRDVVARAITQEVREGRGSPHGGAFLDIASKRKPEEIRKKLPSMWQQFHELADVDITRQPMEVYPTTHYVMGGVLVDPETQQATVPGLFAAGEVGGGLHGANRLGGNSLSDLLVFGRRAGAGAAGYAKAFAGEPRVETAQVEGAVAELLAPFERTGGGENPYAVQEALQDMMGTYVGIARKEDDLRTALAELEKLRARLGRVVVDGNRQYNPGWNTAIDLGNLLAVSEAVTRAALERRESRGAHTRVEYPDSDTHFGTVNVIVRRQGKRMTVAQEPIPPLPEELRHVVEGEV